MRPASLRPGPPGTWHCAGVKDALLFAGVAFIWGTTWLAAKLQTGVVPVEIALIYRMGGAGVLLFGWLLLRRGLPRLSRRDHLCLAALGLLMFGLNYQIAYLALARLPSGVVALLSSLLVPVNAVALRLVYGKPLEPRVMIGAACGIAGLCLVFSRDVATLHLSGSEQEGIALVLLSLLVVAAGQMVAVRNGRRGIPASGATAWGLLYGTVFLMLLAVARGSTPVLPMTVTFVGSLLYLIGAGTIVVFWWYLTLLHRIGADRASFVSVAYPVVALAVSTLFEGYVWSAPAVAGVALVIVGNAVALWPAGR